jgi:hypothetical protein
MGGYFHGLTWTLPLNETTEILHIGVLEPLALLGSVLHFHAFLDQVGAMNEGALIIAECDALVTAMAVPDDRFSATITQYTHSILENLPQYQHMKGNMAVAHIYGPLNIMADASSRGNFDLMNRVSAALRVPLTWLNCCLDLDTSVQFIETVNNVAAFSATLPPAPQQLSHEPTHSKHSKGSANTEIITKNMRSAQAQKRHA